MAWSAGFGLLIVLILASGAITRGTEIRSAKVDNKTFERLPLATIAKYIGQSFIPSALLVAVTAHISTDVASAPFIWIVPLALFLLTFVLIFRDKPMLPMKLVHQCVPILIGLIFLTTLFSYNIFFTLGVHLLFFFAAALMCHHHLYELRPKAEQLTQFYLWMSLGGVLGGIFSGLLAPYIFNTILEYPILVSLVMLAHPKVYGASKTEFAKQVWPALGVGLAAIAVAYIIQNTNYVELDRVVVPMIIAAGFVVTGAFRHNLVRVTLIPFVFVLLAFRFASGSETIFERSFFGVYRISIHDNSQFRVLTFGTTTHGATRIKNADGSTYSGPAIPLSYYHPDGLLAQTLHKLPVNPGGRDIAIVGLGTGAQACNAMAGDRFTYFEIDSLVAKIALDQSKFNFMANCAPDAKIILGDARLTLNEQHDVTYDYLLLDAFSSDSIPVHLLTKEAFVLYVQHLKQNGLLVFHTSNRNMELQTIVTALAKDAGLSVKAAIDPQETGKLGDKFASSVVVLAKQPETLNAFTEQSGWKLPDTHQVTVWTDDYANIPAAIWRHYAGFSPTN